MRVSPSDSEDDAGWELARALQSVAKYLPPGWVACITDEGQMRMLPQVMLRDDELVRVLEDARNNR